MAFCTNCGSPTDGDFCPNCGARVTPADETVLLNTESPVEGIGGPAEEKLAAAPEAAQENFTPAPPQGYRPAAPQPPQAPQAPRPQQAPQAPQYAQPNYQAAPQYGYAQQQPSYTNNYYTAPARAITEADLPEQYKPIKAWGYFGYTLLFSIPIVGLILLIVFSCSSANINRRNFARSYWCALIIIAAIALVFGILILAGVAHVEWPSGWH